MRRLGATVVPGPTDPAGRIYLTRGLSAGVRDRAALAGRAREAEHADRVAADVDRQLDGVAELVAVEQTRVVAGGPVAARAGVGVRATVAHTVVVADAVAPAAAVVVTATVAVAVAVAVAGTVVA